MVQILAKRKWNQFFSARFHFWYVRITVCIFLEASLPGGGCSGGG